MSFFNSIGCVGMLRGGNTPLSHKLTHVQTVYDPGAAPSQTIYDSNVCDVPSNRLAAAFEPIKPPASAEAALPLQPLRRGSPREGKL